MTDPGDIAALAAHVDRRGRVLIRSSRGRIPPNGLVLTVAAAPDERPTLDRLADMFGGRTVDGRWQVEGGAAETALRMLLPCLDARRGQAEIGLRFRALAREVDAPSRGGIQAERERCREQLDALNVQAVAAR